MHWLENTVLSFIPGYEFIKSMATMTVGQQELPRQVVLVQIEDALQIGFLVERMDDGRAVVFVPDAPNSRTGAIFFMIEATSVALGFLTIRRISRGRRWDCWATTSQGSSRCWPVTAPWRWTRRKAAATTSTTSLARARYPWVF
jgi:hypothetical protein